MNFTSPSEPDNSARLGVIPANHTNLLLLGGMNPSAQRVWRRTWHCLPTFWLSRALVVPLWVADTNGNAYLNCMWLEESPAPDVIQPSFSSLISFFLSLA